MFVEVALTSGIATDLVKLLDESAPDLDPEHADTAVFYSISNCQPGLAGVNLGNALIKEVVEQLTVDLPSVHRFVTLSPIPGFRRWLESELAADAVSDAERELLPAEPARVPRAACPTRTGARTKRSNPRSWRCARAILTTRTTAAWLGPGRELPLRQRRRRSSRSTGSRTRARAARSPAGLMSNYLYEPDHIARRAERYAHRRRDRVLQARSRSCSPSRFRPVEKLVYLIWDRPSRDPEDLRKQFVEDLGPRVLAVGSTRARGARRRRRRAGPDDGQGSRRRASRCARASRSGSTAHDFRAAVEDLLAEAGVRRAGYLVTESIYRDYGDNEHAPPRAWPDGERSPGIVMLTIFDKPAGTDDETFYGHWYGHQSPMSEWMQPRCRYVRNTVVRALTPGAPRYKAIVAEAWPSAEHLTDLPTFFGSPDGSDLGERIRIMLDSTKLLFDPATMRSYTLSEYILKS